MTCQTVQVLIIVIRFRYCKQMVAWEVLTQAQFERRTFHVPNLMLLSKIVCSNRFAFDWAREKFDVWTGPQFLDFNFLKFILIIFYNYFSLFC